MSSRTPSILLEHPHTPLPMSLLLYDFLLWVTTATLARQKASAITTCGDPATSPQLKRLCSVWEQARACVVPRVLLSPHPFFTCSVEKPFFDHLGHPRFERCKTGIVKQGVLAHYGRPVWECHHKLPKWLHSYYTGSWFGVLGKSKKKAGLIPCLTFTASKNVLKNGRSGPDPGIPVSVFSMLGTPSHCTHQGS